mmetsp:Transcript_2012/g.5742  ORF Transcript_2012/g.5742 Transcript_2012/m.5742 type:complete len:164 (+) Transcript_2012:566-1057(+)
MKSALGETETAAAAEAMASDGAALSHNIVWCSMSEVKETVPRTKPTGGGFVFVLVVVVEVVVMVEVVEKVEVLLTVVVETVLVVLVDVVVVNIHPMSNGLVELSAGQAFAPSMQTPLAKSPQDSLKSSWQEMFAHLHASVFNARPLAMDMQPEVAGSGSTLPR